jgi:acyl-coenzyme A thioesterase PaaI-like protein
MSSAAAPAHAPLSRSTDRAPLRLLPPHAAAKPSSASRVLKTLLVVPALVQHCGTLFGGALMAIVDEVATIAATRHAGCAAVTARSLCG